MTLEQLIAMLEEHPGSSLKEVAFAILPRNSKFGFPKSFTYRVVTEDEEILAEWTVDVHLCL